MMTLDRLKGLKKQVIDQYSRLDHEADQLKADILRLNAPENAKKFSPAYLREQIAARQDKAKEVAAEHLPDMTTVNAVLSEAERAYSTESYMRQARFVPRDLHPSQEDLLEEITRLRIGSELRHGTVDELVDTLADAKASNSLALLEITRREVGRRKIDDPVARLALTGALDDAIANIEIPGQKAMNALIAEIRGLAEAAEDASAHLRTGVEPDRAKAMRLGAQHRARVAEKAG